MLTEIIINKLRTDFIGTSKILYDSFYEQFQDLKSKNKIDESVFLERFSKAIEICYTSIESSKPAIEEYFKTESPYFNVFKIIGVDRKEVSTHTPFLANLLSPFESHQQNKLFLNLFLQQVLKLPIEDLENQTWSIKKEFEQIDLRIVNTYLRRAIFIENKVDTAAHSGQLSRYFKNWKQNYYGGAFIYLTVSGDLPPIEGFDENIYPKSEVLKELQILSYKKDIYKWLDSSILEIKSKKVQYTVKQYLELLEML